MQLWAASGNKGKLSEYEVLLKGVGIELHSQNELSFYSSPEETGETFLDNARIKAKSLASVKNDQWVFAEDSGLVAEGLGGMPGVHSARYAGNNAGDLENRAKLLKMMKIRSATNRKASFVATIVLISPTKEEFIFEGEMLGSISLKEEGTAGFGYDPVFIPEGYEKTLASMDLAIKNSISHRQKAALKMLACLKEQL